MKRFLSLLLMLTLVVSVASVASAKDKTSVNQTFKERAANTYNPSLKKVELNITKSDKLTTTTYNAVYIPVKDIFKASGATIKWDKKKKITTITNEDHELILNFSGKPISAGKNQVVVPEDWVKLNKGVSCFDAFTLAYIFEVAADDSDQERLNWQEQLSFLNIKETTGLPGMDKYMHVFVEYSK